MSQSPPLPTVAEPSLSRARWIALVALLLLLAGAVRIMPALLMEHVSPDAVEFLDIAQNWKSTGKPLLAIKAYYYEQTPVIHYGGYERPLLPALFLGLGVKDAKDTRPGDAPIRRAQIVIFFSALLFVLLLVCLMERIYGPFAALAAGLLVSLSPLVLTASLFPWADILSLAAATLALCIPAWLDPKQDSRANKQNTAASRTILVEMLAGLAIGLAAAMRSTNLLMLAPMALYMLQTRPSAAARARAVLLLLVGPALFLLGNAWLNLQNGAPALMMPQNFLYRTLQFDDGIHYWAQREGAASVFALLQAHAPAVARQLVKQTIAYAYILVFYHEWLFVWCLALPLVLTRIFRRKLHPLALAMATTALLNLALYCASWPTYDPRRFLLIPTVFLLAPCVGEAWRAWRGARLPLGARGIPLPYLLIAITGIAWGLLAIRQTFTAVRAHQAGERFVPYGQDPFWNDRETVGLIEGLRTQLPSSAIIASRNPWAIRYLSGHPGAYWPHDLDTAALTSDFLRAYPVSAILLDASESASAHALRQLPGWSETRIGRYTLYTR